MKFFSLEMSDMTARKQQILFQAAGYDYVVDKETGEGGAWLINKPNTKLAPSIEDTGATRL